MACGAQEHANIIRCYRCWQDTDSHCINLITEYFTSGNLREYRQKHRHLDTKAVKKWARQVSGLVRECSTCARSYLRTFARRCRYSCSASSRTLVNILNRL